MIEVIIVKLHKDGKLIKLNSKRRLIICWVKVILCFCSGVGLAVTVLSNIVLKLVLDVENFYHVISNAYSNIHDFYHTLLLLTLWVMLPCNAK